MRIDTDEIIALAASVDRTTFTCYHKIMTCWLYMQVRSGGAEGTRTPDPHTASVVRYQLRHGPKTSPVSRAPAQ
jgi:hypothetical protein